MIDVSKYELIAEVKDGAFVSLKYKGVYTCMVYLIMVGDEYYIGSTIRPYERMRQHLEQLATISHYSRPFQSKWNQYKSFTAYALNDFEIPKDELRKREKEFILALNPTLNGMIDRKKESGQHKVPIAFSEMTYRTLWMKKMAYNMKKDISMKEISISQMVSDIVDEWIDEHWEELEDELKVLFPSEFRKGY